jgi:hypothetical protein
VHGLSSSSGGERTQKPSCASGFRLAAAGGDVDAPGSPCSALGGAGETDPLGRRGRRPGSGVLQALLRVTGRS